MRSVKSRPKFLCFSPQVMIATFVVEFGLILFMLVRYGIKKKLLLPMLLILFLGLFQLAEFYVSEGDKANVSVWSRFGFACISMLPPLGLHLMHQLAKKRPRILVWGYYGLTLGIIGYFLSADSVFTAYEATGNYIIFRLYNGVAGAYSVFYYVGFLASFWVGLRKIKSLKSDTTNAAHKTTREIYVLLVGYLLFILPTVFLVLYAPGAHLAIPSIMCGFAILLALTLAFELAPLLADKKSLKSKK
jgi:hypothetical protein